MRLLLASALAAGITAGMVQAPLIAPAFAQEPAPAGESADQAVAKVNGEAIMFSDLALAEEELGGVLDQLPQNVRFQYLLSMLIDRKILSQEAEEKGLGDDPSVKRRVDYYKEKALRDVYWTQLISGKATDEALKDYYQQEIAAREPEDEVRARHILVASEAEAREVIAEIEGGKAFEEVAAEKSTGPSGENGGDLGYFVKTDMVEPFAEAAFQLKPGEISEPVETQFGWHVIKLEDRRPQPKPSFEEVKDELTAQFLQEEGKALIEKLRNDATIEIVGADGGSSRPVIAPQ